MSAGMISGSTGGLDARRPRTPMQGAPSAQLLFDHDATVAGWIASRVGVECFAEPYRAIGFLKDGRLVGGALFNSYNGANVDLTIAGRAVVCRGAWRAIRSYAFDQMKCRRLSVIVKASNTRVRAMALRFGFKAETDLAAWFEDDDGVMFSLLRSDCKW